MLSFLYPVSFSVSLIGLILWFYNQENRLLRRRMSQLFLGGFFVYAFSLAFASGELSFKFWVLFRDMMVLGLVSQFFGFFRKNKSLFFGMLILLFGIFPFTFYKKLQNTFPQQGTTSAISNSIELSDDGELLVDIADGEKVEKLNSIIEKYNLTYERAFYPNEKEFTDLDDYVMINIPDNFEGEIEKIEKELMESGFVDYLERNEIVQLPDLETQKTSKRKRSYGVNDPGINELWGFDELRMDELYDLLKKNKIKPKRKANIFILDTGIDAGHEDIKDNYVSHNSKYDYDKQGHGTHCAGIAAAVTNNKKGVASYAPNNDFVNVTSVKVLTDYGSGTQKSIIGGMLEAADNGADVISMSLGGRSNKNRRRAYARAVNYCNRKGAIVVAAAGNSDMDAANYSPANAPGIITVAAIDTNLNKASFSNYVQNVQYGIAAPGVNIYSTFPKNQYKSLNGTSMACPYVAGLIGIMKSINPDLKTDKIYEILNQTGKETSGGETTGNLIQPAGAIKELFK